MKDSNKKGHPRCPHCGHDILRDGKLYDGKFYHNVCADNIALTMACRDAEVPKRIFIANGRRD